ncbi:MAG: helix-turn-helix transcriptional regulator [Candidatus Methanomethylophilaceae archaeon]|jgi:putative transcriptional regulator|nr:helix-turn-helix transcriptional regulator [Candidatus Methanomethylophilaceae archaeon]
MPIVIRLDHVMLDKKMTLVELSKRVGITNVNLSKLKTGKVSAIRLSTLEAICDVLDCQPGDILEFRREEGPDVEEEPSDEDVPASSDSVEDRQDVRPAGS